MRPLSRLLSVLLALILLGIPLQTASAHTDNQGQTIEHNAENPTYGVTLTISLQDYEDPIHVGDKLTFFVIVERTNHFVPFSATLRGLTGGLGSGIQLGEDVDDNLDQDGMDVWSMEVEYTVQGRDLGGGARRVAPIQFRLDFTPVDNLGRVIEGHGSASVLSNEFDVVITKKGPTSGGSSEVEVVFDLEKPDEIAEGEKVEFTLSVVTGKYGLTTKPFIIRKQLYDADGEKIGRAAHAKSIIIRPLRTQSVSEQRMASYTLTEKDAEAATIEFFYKVVIEDSNLREADNTLADLDEDFEEVFEDSIIIGKPLPTTTTTTVTATPRPRATATPTPNPIIGRTSAVTVTRLSINRIRFDLRHGHDFNLSIGWIAPNGTRGYNRNGYIRDEGLGQTYAVVNRESDNKVVRVWIAPDSEERYAVPWEEVLEFYTFPQAIVNAIPLDELHPAVNQLVQLGGDYYVYYAGSWRHIPDIPTFQARGYYWCDVTSADTGFLRRVLIGRALQSSGTDETIGYPNCRE